MKITNPSIVSGALGDIQTWITLDSKNRDALSGNRNSNNKLNTSRNTMNSKSDRKKASPVEKESIKEIEKKTIKASVNTQAKIEYVAQLWWNTGYATQFVTECKAYATNPDHCIMRGSSIAKHESNAGKQSNAFFGVLVDRKQSYTYQITRRVQRYNRNYRYNRLTVKDRQRGWYCQHENDWTPGCPIWNMKVWGLALNYSNKF